MHWIDANIGMMKEDIEIFKFGLSYTTNSFSFSGGNMAKLHKSNVFDIWRAIYEHGRGNVFKVSLQHQDKQILKNINRPELPWNEHKKLLINFRQKYNKAEYKVELIHGLPGATIEAHKKQLIEFSEIPISIASLYAWELLHSSPAYDKSYQEKHNLKIITAGVVNTNVINSTIDDLYHNVSSDNYNPIEIYQSERICDSNLGFKEYLIITYMTILYNMLFETTLTTSEYNKIRFINFLDYAMPIIEKLAGEQTKDWDEKLEKYGFIIFGLPFGSNKTQTVQLGLGLTMICNKLFSGLLSGNIQTPWWDAYGHIEDKTKQRGSLSEV